MESGVLLHVTSLPSKFGVGDVGPACREFLRFLANSKQRIWQTLPLTPTDPSTGNSPYFCSSLFAGNELLVSLEVLAEEGLVDLSQLRELPSGPVDYEKASLLKREMLDKAYDEFRRRKRTRELEDFLEKHLSWLEDFALFSILKKTFRVEWCRWPKEARNREKGFLERLRSECKEEIERVIFGQYVFYKQWGRIRELCKELGIKILGDLPMYPAHDSCDVWARPELFKLDEQGFPTHLSGAPPDRFSSTGQLWSTPVYRWEKLEEEKFDWWVARVKHALNLFDMVRLDHFRGFVAYWEVEADQKTAVGGRWAPAPAEKLLSVLCSKFSSSPFVAEDLGFITPDVVEVMKKFKIPGMRVLIFGFGGYFLQSPHLPSNFEEDCLVYTGTHDTGTVRGWFEEATEEIRSQVFQYLGKVVTPKEISWEFIKLAHFSKAKISIIPAQDLLCLGNAARMNRPGITTGNWRWRLLPGQLSQTLEKAFRELTEGAGRAG